MHVDFVNSRDLWNDYIQRHAGYDGGFLQSWEWGEFQSAYGRKAWRLGIMDNGELVYGWQIIQMALPMGLKYFYIPRPVTKNQKSKIKNQNDISKIKNFIFQIKKMVHDQKAIFVRIDGGEGFDLAALGFKKANTTIQPKEEFIIDITKSEEELLAEMKQKTRYNIRLAEKHGIIVTVYPSPALRELGAPSPARGEGNSSLAGVRVIDEFWKLVEKTSKRQGIRPHPKSYYEKMLEVLGSDGIAKMYTAENNTKIIAASIVTFFGKIATYLHGGSDEGYKQYMAPYLLQWRAICDAKANGYSYYNFGGVSSTKKSWEGITRFKTGFSPQTEFTKYEGVWDLAVNNLLYRLYFFVKKFKM